MTATKPRTFKKDKAGNIVANSQDNIKLALSKLAAKLSYDLLKEKPLLNGAPLQDHDLTHLWLTIEREFKFRPDREYFRDVVINLTRANAFHPVLDYLDGLKWDGKARLDGWLHTHLNALDNDYVNAVGSITLRAAVKRVREPGCKFDELPILESPQGDGKTTALRNLCYDPAWYTACLPLGASSKVVIEQTSGFWIAEIEELQGLKKTDWDKLKASLSRQERCSTASFRAPYNVSATAVHSDRNHQRREVPERPDRQPSFLAYTAYPRRDQSGRHHRGPRPTVGRSGGQGRREHPPIARAVGSRGRSAG